MSIDGLPHLGRWIDAIAERPAARRGVAVPEYRDIDAMVREADEAASKVRGTLV